MHLDRSSRIFLGVEVGTVAALSSAATAPNDGPSTSTRSQCRARSATRPKKSSSGISQGPSCWSGPPNQRMDPAITPCRASSSARGESTRPLGPASNRAPTPVGASGTQRKPSKPERSMCRMTGLSHGPIAGRRGASGRRGTMGMPRLVAVRCIWVSFCSAAERLVRRPSTSPSQPR